MKINLDKKSLILSVGELADLITDSTATSAGLSLPVRGKLGSVAHQSYQNERNKNGSYQQEVHLNVPVGEGSFGLDDWTIRLRGRIDGLSDELDRTVVEEVKTVALPPERFRSISPTDYPRHQRQLEIYLYLLSLLRPERPVCGNLIYINLWDKKRRTFFISDNSNEVAEQISEIIGSVIAGELRRLQEKEKKRALANRLEFPFPALRTGQDEISTAVARSLEEKENLLIEAPTGLGKTAAVLAPALRYALAQNKQVLFLTSKTTQQSLAYETAVRIKSNNDFPRILLLRARAKLCPEKDLHCHPDLCPYLENFATRLRREEILGKILSWSVIHPDNISQLGLELTLCPYELQIAVCRDADLIIGDYNYAFDPGCKLACLFEEQDSSHLIFIVDEAHNLPDRARGYYSAALRWQDIKDAYDKLNDLTDHSFDSVVQSIQSQFEYYLRNAPNETDPYPIQFSLPMWGKILQDFENALIPYWCRLASDRQELLEDPVLILHRALDSFLRSLSLEGDHFAGLVRRSPFPSLEHLCLDASPYLKETFSSIYSSIVISATLQPFTAYQRLLGISDTFHSLSVDNPFPSVNRKIIVDPSVTTLFREREDNYEAITERIISFFRRVNRKMLVFFPSFEFMRRIVADLGSLPLFVQREDMDDRQRDELLTDFKGRESALLCSVMGGVFAEGIDLSGDLAQAAVIVGVGLPHICVENQLLRAYHDRIDGNGFETAYLYPGMRRVIQAVGRVIRSEKDMGIILLLDRRFADENYQKLLPRHWYSQHPDELICRNWEESVEDFLSTRVL